MSSGLRYDVGLELVLATGEGKPGEPWKPVELAALEVQKKYVEWRAHGWTFRRVPARLRENQI